MKAKLGLTVDTLINRLDYKFVPGRWTIPQMIEVGLTMPVVMRQGMRTTEEWAQLRATARTTSDLLQFGATPLLEAQLIHPTLGKPIPLLCDELLFEKWRNVPRPAPHCGGGTCTDVSASTTLAECLHLRAHHTQAVASARYDRGTISKDDSSQQGQHPRVELQDARRCVRCSRRYDPRGCDSGPGGHHAQTSGSAAPASHPAPSSVRPIGSLHSQVIAMEYRPFISRGGDPESEQRSRPAWPVGGGVWTRVCGPCRRVHDGQKQWHGLCNGHGQHGQPPP